MHCHAFHFLYFKPNFTVNENKNLIGSVYLLSTKQKGLGTESCIYLFTLFILKFSINYFASVFIPIVYSSQFANVYTVLCQYCLSVLEISCSFFPL